MQSVPKNTSSAITTRKIEDNKGIPRDRYFTYNPPTRGNYSSYHIPAPRDFRNLLIPEKDLNRQIDNEDKSFRKEITLLKNEVELKKKQLLPKRVEKRQYEVNITTFFKRLLQPLLDFISRMYLLILELYVNRLQRHLLKTRSC